MNSQPLISNRMPDVVIILTPGDGLCYTFGAHRHEGKWVYSEVVRFPQAEESLFRQEVREKGGLFPVDYRNVSGLTTVNGESGIAPLLLVKPGIKLNDAKMAYNSIVMQMSQNATRKGEQGER